MIGLTYDLTEQKNAEEKIAQLLRFSQDMNTRLLASEEELRKALENTLKLNERIRESEMRWQFALEGSNSGVWDWNLQTNEVFYSEKLKDLLGYGNDEAINHLSHWEAKIHPDDRALVMSAIDAHLSGSADLHQVEYRAMRSYSQLPIPAIS